MRAALILGLLAFAGGAIASTARADGLPVLGIDVGASGVVAPAAGERYVTLPAGPNTVLARVDRAGGRVLESRFLRGAYTIPAVAYDGTADGLSANGLTLVLIRPRVKFPQPRTRFVLVDVAKLRPERFVTLRGDFSLDAVSPDGSLVYFIQYLAAGDPTRYAVRAYDARAGRLLAAHVVDPHERGEAMRGSPITRAASPDGRWAYTLYDGLTKEPFVHALDTRSRTARCIDLPMLAGTRRNLYTLRLRVGEHGRQLSVQAGPRAIATIDTHTFDVRTPQVPSKDASRNVSKRSVWPQAAVAGALAVLLAAATVIALRRRRRPLAEGALSSS